MRELNSPGWRLVLERMADEPAQHNAGVPVAGFVTAMHTAYESQSATRGNKVKKYLFSANLRRELYASDNVCL